MKKIVSKKRDWEALGIKSRAYFYRKIMDESLFWTPLGILPEKFIKPLVTKGIIAQDNKNPLFYNWTSRSKWMEWLRIRDGLAKELEDFEWLSKYYDNQDFAIVYSTRTGISEEDFYSARHPLPELTEKFNKMKMTEESKALAKEYKHYQDLNDRIIGL